MPDEIPTGIGCPTCWNNGNGIQAMLFSRPGKFVYYCRSGHDWPDTQELLDLNPPKLQVPQKKTLQQGHENVSISIPGDLKQELLAKFGTPERLAQTLAGVLRTLAESQCLLVNEEDTKRIETIVGTRPKTGSELVGTIYQLNETVKELKNSGPQQNGNVATPGAVVPEGKILIDTQEFIQKARAVANFRHERVEHVLESTLKMAFDNGWA